MNDYQKKLYQELLNLLETNPGSFKYVDYRSKNNDQI